jgi:hypothetical protein
VSDQLRTVIVNVRCLFSEIRWSLQSATKSTVQRCTRRGLRKTLLGPPSSARDVAMFAFHLWSGEQGSSEHRTLLRFEISNVSVRLSRKQMCRCKVESSLEERI